MIDKTQDQQYASFVIRKLLKKDPEFQKLFNHNSFEGLRNLCLKYRSSFYTVKNLKPASFKDLIDLSVREIKKHWDVLYKLKGHYNIIQQEAVYIEDCFKSLDSDNLSDISGIYKKLLGALEKVNVDKVKLKKDLKEQFGEGLKKCKNFFKNKHFYQINKLIEFSNYFSLFDKLAIKFMRDFEKIKNEEEMLSLSDLEFMTVKILREKPEIIKSFSEEWDYWLIDEYQDTTPLQAEILNKFRDSSKEFIVGDPQQSIYLFRGARSEVFENKQADMKNIQYLNNNYRSSPSLVYFFNDFFKNMGQKFLEMTPKNSNITFDPVAVFICYKEREKNESHDSAVIAEVTDLLNKGASYSDICIIGRTNDHLSRIAHQLSQKNIPYRLFTSSKAPLQQIRQLNALLKLLLNPYDNLNFVELMGSSWLGVSRSDLYQLVKQSKKNKTDSLWQELLSSKKNSFYKVKTKLKTLFLDVHQMGVTETLKKACIEMKMIDLCRVYDPSGHLEAHLWKYFAKLQDEEQKPDFNYLKFVSDIINPSDLESDSLPSLEEDQLQLMTVHKSKGLEFQHVLIPHLNDTYKFKANSFYVLEEASCCLWGTSLKFEGASKKICLAGDLAKEKIKQRETEELERLLYVAMTRAKKSVHLFCDDQKSVNTSSWQNRSGCHLWIEGKKGKQEKKKYNYEVKYFDGKIPQLNTQKETVQSQMKAKLQIQAPYIKRISVSDLLDKTFIEDKQNKIDYRNQKQQDILQNILKTDLGNSYHKILQIICFHPYLIEKPAKDIINEYFSYDFQEDKKEQIIQSLDFLLSLKSPLMKKLLRRGHAEWPFLHHKGQEAIEGKIDLWGKIDDTIWVIDYKTGRRSNDKKVFQQLSLYGQALAERYKQKMKLAAIYLLEQEVMIYDKA